MGYRETVLNGALVYADGSEYVGGQFGKFFTGLLGRNARMCIPCQRAKFNYDYGKTTTGHVMMIGAQLLQRLDAMLRQGITGSAINIFDPELSEHDRNVLDASFRYLEYRGLASRKSEIHDWCITENGVHEARNYRMND